MLQDPLLLNHIKFRSKLNVKYPVAVVPPLELEDLGDHRSSFCQPESDAAFFDVSLQNLRRDLDRRRGACKDSVNDAALERRRSSLRGRRTPSDDDMRGSCGHYYHGSTANPSNTDVGQSIASSICKSRGLRHDFATVLHSNPIRSRSRCGGVYASSLKEYLDRENNAFMQDAFGSDKSNLTERATRYLETTLAGQDMCPGQTLKLSEYAKSRDVLTPSNKSYSSLSRNKSGQKDVRNALTFSHQSGGPLDRIFSSRTTEFGPPAMPEVKKKHDRRLPTTLAVPRVSCPSDTALRNVGALFETSSTSASKRRDVMPTVQPPSPPDSFQMSGDRKPTSFYLIEDQDENKKRFIRLNDSHRRISDQVNKSGKQRDESGSPREKGMTLDFFLHEVVSDDSLEHFFSRQKLETSPSRHMYSQVGSPDQETLTISGRDNQSPERDVGPRKSKPTLQSPFVAEEKDDYIHRLQRMFSRSKSRPKDKAELGLSKPKSRISWTESFKKVKRNDVQNDLPSSENNREERLAAPDLPPVSNDNSRLHDYSSMEHCDKIRFKWCGLTSVFSNIKPQDKPQSRNGLKTEALPKSATPFKYDVMVAEAKKSDDAMRRNNLHQPNIMTWKNKRASEDSGIIFRDTKSEDQDVEKYDPQYATLWNEAKAMQTLRWLQNKGQSNREMVSGEESEDSGKPASRSPAVYPVSICHRSRRKHPEVDLRRESERSNSGDGQERHVKFSQIMKRDRSLCSDDEHDIDLVEALRAYPLRSSRGSSQTPSTTHDHGRAKSKALDFSRLSPRYQKWLARRHKPSSPITTDKLEELKKSMELPSRVREQIDAKINKQKQIDYDIKKQKQIDHDIKKQKQIDYDIRKQKQIDYDIKKQNQIDVEIYNQKQIDYDIKRQKKIDAAVYKQKQIDAITKRQKQVDYEMKKQKQIDSKSSKQKQIDSKSSKQKQVDLKSSKQKQVDSKSKKKQNR